MQSLFVARDIVRNLDGMFKILTGYLIVLSIFSCLNPCKDVAKCVILTGLFGCFVNIVMYPNFDRMLESIQHLKRCLQSTNGWM